MSQGLDGRVDDFLSTTCDLRAVMNCDMGVTFGFGRSSVSARQLMTKPAGISPYFTCQSRSMIGFGLPSRPDAMASAIRSIRRRDSPRSRFGSPLISSLIESTSEDRSRPPGPILSLLVVFKREDVGEE